MKLKYKMEVMDLDGSPVAIPADCDENFRGILQMNGTTADILKCLEKEVTEDEIVAALEKQYNAAAEQIHGSVQKVVSILREHQLIAE